MFTRNTHFTHRARTWHRYRSEIILIINSIFPRIKPKLRAQFKVVLAITALWMLVGVLLALYKCVNYDPVTDAFIFLVPKHLTLGSFVLVSLIGPTIGGLMGGSVLVMVFNDKLADKAYWYYILVSILFFFAVIFLLNVGVSYFLYYSGEIANSDSPVRRALELFVLDPYAVRNIISWMIIAWLTAQGLKVYEKYGPGTFVSMFIGRYRRPHEVQRVFMFLDLSNSTTIAEGLGHVTYFALIRDFFFDVTDPIINSRGKIYQYVGDEIVISWPLKRAVSKELNCIACFFNIAEKLNQREPYYMQKYGLLPQFKAAVHQGKVVVGEIGVIKKEIVYSGDVLNTTARMMEQCKLHDQKLIISDDIVDLAGREKLTGYKLTPLGDMSLRGKVQKISLFGVGKYNKLISNNSKNTTAIHSTAQKFKWENPQRAQQPQI